MSPIATHHLEHEQEDSNEALLENQKNEFSSFELADQFKFNHQKYSNQMGHKISQNPMTTEASQSESLIYGQKIKTESNEIRLGNVKAMLFDQQKNISQNSQFSNLENRYEGREFDRNQLSVEIMNITPIMEEKERDKNSYQKSKHLQKETQNDEQFSFDKDFHFNPEENNKSKELETEPNNDNLSDMMDMDEKNLVSDLEKIEQAFTIKHPKSSFNENLKMSTHSQVFDYLDKYDH